jgi:galactoside 2-L-fucosyltransferase 1/2
MRTYLTRKLWMGSRLSSIALFICVCIIASRVYSINERRESNTEYISEELRTWVAWKPHGQLGNQLWVISSMYGIARIRKSNWCVMDKYDLDIFHPNKEWTTYSALIEWKTPPPLLCSDISSVNSGCFLSDACHFKPIHDGTISYYSDVYAKSQWPFISVDGELQSFRYFDKDMPLPFKLKATPKARAWVQSRNFTAAIHVRRGDKLGGDGNVVPPVEYFELAVAKLRELFPTFHQNFVVTSDDPEWVRSQAIFQGMYILSSDDQSFDMAVISECKYKIISIGTFGWFGAFLTDKGDNITSVVIYPTLQMEGELATRFNNADYFPSHWIGLDYLGFKSQWLM